MDKYSRFFFSNLYEALAWAKVSFELTWSGEKKLGYWWDGESNFGDLFTPYLIDSIAKIEVKNVKHTTIDFGPAIVGAGSILQELSYPNAVVWGSGFIRDQLNRRPRSPKTVLAYRGPKSNRVAERIGWPTTDLFGDPGILASMFNEKITTPGLVGVIPHYQHKKLFHEMDKVEGFELIDVSLPILDVINKISKCEVVLSSSLHGLIVAHSFNIPWKWLRFPALDLTGGDFKFDDFFEGMNFSASPKEMNTDFCLKDLDAAADKSILPVGNSVTDVQRRLFSSITNYLDIKP